MNFRWEHDNRYPDDLDLEVLHADGGWRLIAFIRYNQYSQLYMCHFMGIEDNEFPDGEKFKTKRGAMRFCERHLPVMWIRHNAKIGDKT